MTAIAGQHFGPDQFFTTQQQERLRALMERWRRVRDGQESISPEECAELNALVETELEAATRRAAALVDDSCRHATRQTVK